MNRTLPPSDFFAGPGRIWRVKFGHNPNSSGIGTSSFMLLWSAVLGTLVLNTAGAVMLARWRAGARRVGAAAGAPGAADDAPGAPAVEPPPARPASDP